MTIPEMLWDDERIDDFANAKYDASEYFEVFGAMVIVRDDYERQASLLGMDYEAKLDEYQAVYLYYIELAEKQGARIAELEAQLAEAKPRIRKAETGIRGGLLKGRIRQKGVRDPSQVRPTFDAALQMATTDDLMWALELLIKHPHTKRTWRDHRIKHIDARLREILAAVQP